MEEENANAEQERRKKRMQEITGDSLQKKILR